MARLSGILGSALRLLAPALRFQLSLGGCQDSGATRFPRGIFGRSVALPLGSGETKQALDLLRIPQQRLNPIVDAPGIVLAHQERVVSPVRDGLDQLFGSEPFAEPGFDARDSLLVELGSVVSGVLLPGVEYLRNVGVGFRTRSLLGNFTNASGWINFFSLGSRLRNRSRIRIRIRIIAPSRFFRVV
jgi:hypothetical protein